MSFEIGKTFRFESAHRLHHHGGKCRRPHGHSYEFELIVEQREVTLSGPSAGMVVDYDMLTLVGESICQQLDHRDLNDVLDSDTTTAEELSRIVWEMAKARLPGLAEVRFRETAKTFASYRPARAAIRRATEIGNMVMDDARRRLYEGIDISDPDACWMFAGSTDDEGYGYCALAIAGTNKAHRLSAWLAGDDIDGRVVLHSCDHPTCVNPKHLSVGTHLDNEADKDAKGRRPVGEKHGAAKLNAEQVREIVALRQGGAGRRELAEKFGVSTSLIEAIMHGRVWRSVTGFSRP